MDNFDMYKLAKVLIGAGIVMFLGGIMYLFLFA